MAAKAAAASKKKRKNESAAADAAKAAAAVAARAEIDLRDSSSQNPPKPEEEEEEEEEWRRAGNVVLVKTVNNNYWPALIWPREMLRPEFKEKMPKKVKAYPVRVFGRNLDFYWVAQWKLKRFRLTDDTTASEKTAAQVRAAKRFLQGQPEERHKNWPRYAQKKKKQQQQQPPPQASGKRTLKARPPALKRKRDQEHGATAPTATEAGTEGKRPNDKIRNSPRGRLPTGLDLRSRRRRMLAWAQGYVEKVCDRKEQQKSGKRSSYRVGQSLVPLS
uniref:PWWP domain-containing protein n=1 Tax=Bigelowiella natans TaxID=227086 RepID=A0A7S2P4H8_BIGNA